MNYLEMPYEEKWLPVSELHAVPRRPIVHAFPEQAKILRNHIIQHPIKVIKQNDRHYVVAGNETAAMAAHISGSWETPILCRVYDLPADSWR